MYTDIVMEHFSNPRNVGTMDDPDGYSKVGSPVCGDLMEVYLRIADGRIADIKFRTFGCGAAIASSSMASTMIKGKTIEEASRLTDARVAEELGGLPEAKMHCSNLAATAIQAAIADYYERHPEARSQQPA
ncbi:MAG: iron-sulfur cluster assembly scaffold protein [Chloroflexi bacterium]|jgi:nitrogen fixation NifU-like protein|nr:iron-sulfur cluster assembly scaffold protein [Chloroflexota bacterium]